MTSSPLLEQKMSWIYRNVAFATYGSLYFTHSAFEKAFKSFRKLECPNAGEKVAIVTGANAGLGRQVALELAQRGLSPHFRPNTSPFS
jgi:hypothetical protein